MRAAALGLLAAVATLTFSPASAWAASDTGGSTAKPAIVALAHPISASKTGAACRYRSPACRWNA